MKPAQSHYDCIVMGGGPAGSTAAALIAEADFQTLLVERAALPRACVGESLMPETYAIFKRLGVLDKMKASRYTHKVGVQFVGSSGKESAPFFFRDHDPHESTQTWHVNRAEFDSMLFQNAASKGAECHDRMRVTDVIFDGDRAIGVELQSNKSEFQNPKREVKKPNRDKNNRDLTDRRQEPQEVTAAIVVDATGLQAILGNKLDLRRVNPDLRKAAIWGHFRGGVRDEAGGGVKTVILQTSSKRTWFWYIPQADDLVSVGVVGDNQYLLKGRGAPEETFYEELQQCEVLERWLAGAELADELAVLKEFSYSSDRAAGDGWVLVGDAWGFIDPIYSSGVFFAMKSAEMAADAIVDGLRRGDTSAATIGRWIPEFTKQTGLIRKLVNAFYSGHFRVGKFIEQYPQHQEELVDLLIGRIFDGREGRIFDDLDPWLEQMRIAE